MAIRLARCLASLLLIILFASGLIDAEVSRTVSIEMTSFTDIEYIKTKTYTGNETYMIRAQVDESFGNNDGVVTYSETETFRSFQENYSSNPANFASDPLYNLTGNLVFDIELLDILSANFTVKNLTGAYNDSAIIETIQVKKVKVHTLTQEFTHVITVKHEIWEYTDLKGKISHTVNNNISFTAPEGWLIDTSTVPGILNKVYSDGNRTVRGNGYPLGNVFIRIYMEGHAPEPDHGVENGEEFPWAFWSGLSAVLVIAAVAWVLHDQRGKEGEEEVERDPELAGLTLEELTQRKEECTSDILCIRAQLQEDDISKAKAKEKERELKARFKAIQREIDEWGKEPSK